MNDLSWFLYWAEVLPNLGLALQIVSFVLCLVLVVVFMGTHIWYSDLPLPKVYPTRLVTFTVIGFFFFGIVWTAMWLVPGRQTIYMIAASEMGEVVVTSPEAKEMYDDLKSIIKNYAGDLAQKATP